MRSSNIVFIESQSLFFFQTEDMMEWQTEDMMEWQTEDMMEWLTEDMMEWLTDRLLNVTESKNKEMIQSFLVDRSWNQWFLSKKIFCTRRSRKKKMFSKI